MPMLESFDYDMDSIDTVLSSIFCLPIGLPQDEDTKKPKTSLSSTKNAFKFIGSNH